MRLYLSVDINQNTMQDSDSQAVILDDSIKSKIINRYIEKMRKRLMLLNDNCVRKIPLHYVLLDKISKYQDIVIVGSRDRPVYVMLMTEFTKYFPNKILDDYGICESKKVYSVVETKVMEAFCIMVAKGVLDYQHHHKLMELLGVECECEE